MSDLSETSPEERIAQLRAAIAAQEDLRPILGDAAVEAVIATLQERLAALEREQPRPLSERAERKPVTILFADLTGFTALAERADPETVRRLMNACFDTLKEVLDRYGGHVDKYIGDEVMALFGAPVAYEDHAERALRAALELQTALRGFGERLADDPQLAHLPPDLRSLDVHIGISTGLVIAGGIGAQDDRQYSVVGDAVNVAARLTDFSTAGQILVGEATYQLTAPLFEFSLLPPVSLKGKRELQQVYQLRGLRVRPGMVRGLEPLGLRAPLVGRAAEVARLQQAIASLQGGQGGAMGIVGEAGVGKSRLIAELRSQVQVLNPQSPVLGFRSLAHDPVTSSSRPRAEDWRLATVNWVEGRCLSYGEMLSYHPFLALLRDLVGVAPEADLATLETHLREFLDDLLPDQATDFYPYLADLLGLPLEPADRERLDNLAGESRQWQTFQVYEAVLLHLARQAPTVVVVEDLHWADPTSLALLEQLLLLSRRVPILFLLVMRPFGGRFCQQFLTSLRGTAGLPYGEIDLSPLSPAHSRELIEYLLAIEALPEPVRDLILGRAEGNPLFLEEILRALIGQGVLCQEGDRWQMAPGVSLDQVTIPPTLQGVILARLDRLEAETKSVLQMAAVIGRLFWYRVLDYIASVEQQLDRMLDQHLGQLEQVELIRQTRQHPDLEYIFKHVLIQEAAYDSLLRERRQLFHRRVAEALESIFAENLEEQYGLLGHHYEVAGETEQAIRYLHLAGDRARRTYALPEAEGYYQQALDLLRPDDDRRRQLLLDLGLVNMTQGDFARAGERYAAAFQIEQQHPDLLRRPHARRPFRIITIPPVTLEPGVPIDIYSVNVIQQLFAGLVEFDAELNVIPHMAERWEVDAGGRRYCFHLRREACWSDGVPLTAHDFVYAWRRWLHPATGSAAAPLMYVLRGAADYHQGRTDDPKTVGVRALDDHTLEVELGDPVAYFLPLLANAVFGPVPSHCWPPARPPQEDPAGLVGNGPFRLVGWEPDVGLALERNPHYCGVFEGNVQRIEMTFFSTNEDNVARFVADELDFCGVSVQNEAELQRLVPAEQWRDVPSLATYYCGLMPDVPPLDDRRVRRALALAVDRARLGALISTSITTAAPARGGFVPPGIPGHSPELSIPHAPEEARTLLRQVGRDLPPLRLANTGGNSILIEDLVQQWQQELGIEVVVESWDISELLTWAREYKPHLFSLAWIADYPDPHNFLREGFYQLEDWDDPMYWTLTEEAARELDVRRRMDLYHELDRRLVVEETLLIPLTYGRATYVIQPRVQHVTVMPVATARFKDIVLAD